ncbi:MAG: tyrosine-protein phosphatase [Actinomycetota bacterium]
MGDQLSSRLLTFEGCFNFRDLGGWQTMDGRTVRSGRLFRADSVHLMTETDATRAGDELGLRTMLDLRNQLEIEAGGVGLLADAGLVRGHFPITAHPDRSRVVDGTRAAPSSDRSPDALVDGYLGILEVSSALIVNAIELLGDADALPAVFFCAAGKDRTGVLSAVVLGAVGVRDEDIVDDYYLTAESIERIIERFAGTPGSPGMYRDLPAQHFAPFRETMERVVAAVRERYGTFGDYLTSKGLSAESLDRLRTSLLDG